MKSIGDGVRKSLHECMAIISEKGDPEGATIMCKVQCHLGESSPKLGSPRLVGCMALSHVTGVGLSGAIVCCLDRPTMSFCHDIIRSYPLFRLHSLIYYQEQEQEFKPDTQSLDYISSTKLEIYSSHGNK